MGEWVCLIRTGACAVECEPATVTDRRYKKHFRIAGLMPGMYAEAPRKVVRFLISSTIGDG